MSLRDNLVKYGFIPPVTPQEIRAQRLDIVYGTLACSTNHKPQRHAFKEVALKNGMSEAEFDRWARGREWWDATKTP